MSITKIGDQLKENLQLAYRQAIDADAKLDQLKKAGHGKFASIFTKEQGFTQTSNRFQPYVSELLEELQLLQEATEFDQAKLESLVRKLGLLLQTLQAFKLQTK